MFVSATAYTKARKEKVSGKDLLDKNLQEIVEILVSARRKKCNLKSQHVNTPVCNVEGKYNCKRRSKSKTKRQKIVRAFNLCTQKDL